MVEYNNIADVLLHLFILLCQSRFEIPDAVCGKPAGAGVHVRGGLPLPSIPTTEKPIT
jgi:hypothetical protein